MTTARSPLRVLKAQADRIAAGLKALERGELPAGVANIGADPAKLAASRQRPTITFGLFMDDKTLKIEMAWSKIAETSEAGLSAFLLKQMRDERDKTH